MTVPKYGNYLGNKFHLQFTDSVWLVTVSHAAQLCWVHTMYMIRYMLCQEPQTRIYYLCVSR